MYYYQAGYLKSSHKLNIKLTRVKPNQKSLKIILGKIYMEKHTQVKLHV